MFEISNLPIIIPVLLLSMGIHEAVHAFTAHALGDTTASDQGRLTLNPLKHVDIYTTVLLPVVLILIGLPPIFAAKPVPFDPSRVRFDEFGAALIGVAGPLSNLLLAAIGGILLRLVPLAGLNRKVALTWVVINIAFFVFNMIPFPPLDGSRLLYAFAPESVQSFMRQIEAFGFMAILFFFFFLVPFLGPVINSLVETIFTFLTGLNLAV